LKVFKGMTTYNIKLEGDILKVSFGEPATNDQIVRDAAECLEKMTETGELAGGSLLKINGPASLPVCYVIAHKVSHLYGAIAVFDPKIGARGTSKYVVCISHNPAYKLGDLID
jgi:CRISPR-associated protein Csx3